MTWQCQKPDRKGGLRPGPCRIEEFGFFRGLWFRELPSLTVGLLTLDPTP
ncbi:MAG: hypothetical protein QOH71_1557 [Blastocatellia bacterium]|jgi:hypothetical protein|nr:hypothetical protein [Blastocatellia bacterium]